MKRKFILAFVLILFSLAYAENPIVQMQAAS